MTNFTKLGKQLINTPAAQELTLKLLNKKEMPTVYDLIRVVTGKNESNPVYYSLGYSGDKTSEKVFHKPVLAYKATHLIFYAIIKSIRGKIIGIRYFKGDIRSINPEEAMSHINNTDIPQNRIDKEQFRKLTTLKPHIKYISPLVATIKVNHNATDRQLYNSTVKVFLCKNGRFKGENGYGKTLYHEEIMSFYNGKKEVFEHPDQAGYEWNKVESFEVNYEKGYERMIEKRQLVEKLGE